MSLKGDLQTPKYRNNGKSGTFEKPQYLPCSQHMQTSESDDIPCPNHSKGLPLNQAAILIPKIEKMLLNEPKVGPSRRPESSKNRQNRTLDPRLPSRMSLWAPNPPKCSSRVPKWRLQVPKITYLATQIHPIHPFHKSTSHPVSS